MKRHFFLVLAVGLAGSAAGCAQRVAGAPQAALSTTESTSPANVDYSPAGVAHIESTEKQFAQRCLDRMGKEFLANVGTVSVARDLDVLRAALGDDKLTYLGYSYGTLIGSAYAEAFGDKVRAMILDGASPSLWSDLTKGLTELTEGRGDTLLELADEYLERDQNGNYATKYLVDLTLPPPGAKC